MFTNVGCFSYLVDVIFVTVAMFMIVGCFSSLFDFVFLSISVLVDFIFVPLEVI